MNIIFLDIDGVLNYTKWYVNERNNNIEERDLDPHCIERVLRICKECDAKIVITSDWRLSWYGTILRLSRMGLSEEFILDKTPELIWLKNINPKIDCSRGAEIQMWLDEHPECSNYVIIDDRTDFTNEQYPHFVHINSMWGIRDENVDNAISILNKKDENQH